MWLLAVKAMVGDRGKLLTSVLGVAFSVILVNLQGGLLLGLIQKASLLVDYGQADIWVGPRHTTNVDMGTFIPERWISRIRGISGVERADPYVIAGSQATMRDGRVETVLLVGCDPGSLLGNAWLMAEGDTQAIRRPDGVLVDVAESEKLGNCRIGDTLEINRQRAQVVGLTRGTIGFTNNAYIFTTLDRARGKYSNNVPKGQCSYFLVRAEPGADVPALCARIRERLPEVDVYDRQTYSRTCMLFWLTRTGIGISFGMTAFLGLLVGLAVVAQTLYASVAERTRELGTLKAMGATEGCMARFLLSQSLSNALLGSLLGLLAAVGVCRGISTERAPVVLTTGIALLSVGLVTLVCLLAVWVPYWRLRTIDPAGVLRS
jgi:putative ABC transport system permease protein